MARRPDRPVTLRQKTRTRLRQPDPPAEPAEEGASGPAPEASESSRPAPVASPAVKRRSLLDEEDLQALADMDRASFEAAMAGTTPLRQPEPGDRVTGTVVRLGRHDAFVGLGGKAEGSIDLAEVSDARGRVLVEVGDPLTAFVVGRVDGGVRLSMKVRGEDAGAFLEQARDEAIPVEGKVSERNTGGYVVELAGRRAFCPVSQMHLPGAGTDLDAVVGSTLTFLVQELRDSDVVVSRRPLLEQEAAERARQLWAEIRVGETRQGTVTSIRDYGAFVDVGGLEGLVHISELAWEHVDDPEKVVTEGQVVQVRVLRIEAAENLLSLSMKALAERAGSEGLADQGPEQGLGTLGELFGGLKLP